MQTQENDQTISDSVKPRVFTALNWVLNPPLREEGHVVAEGVH